ncbi:MAG: mechanosensitive ion channel [Halobacteria archaeon]|nr:mechanosensitive ion channel [Halobacteria archaeon]
MEHTSLPSYLSESVDGVLTALPKIAVGLVFVGVSYLGIKLVLTVLGSVLRSRYSAEESLVVDLVVTVVGIFLWFGVALAFLNIVGMGEVAASFGTSAGFVALGVSYALSNMIADTVAGVYLLRDPDFNPGDEVSAGSVEGVVRSIELRKTRFDVGGDTVVVANREVEKRWTKKNDGG